MDILLVLLALLVAAIAILASTHHSDSYEESDSKPLPRVWPVPVNFPSRPAAFDLSSATPRVPVRLDKENRRPMRPYSPTKVTETPATKRPVAVINCSDAYQTPAILKVKEGRKTQERGEVTPSLRVRPAQQSRL